MQKTYTWLNYFLVKLQIPKTDQIHFKDLLLCLTFIACKSLLLVNREGMSLVPLLRDSDDDWKKAVFYQYKRRNDMGYSVIKDNLRFTAWVHINSTSLEVQKQFLAFHFFF